MNKCIDCHFQNGCNRELKRVCDQLDDNETPFTKPVGILRIGDKVSWRGAWGSHDAVIAIVEGIEINCKGKEGYPVDEVSWEEVKRGGVVVDLSNGHWAYGYQITKAEGRV